MAKGSVEVAGGEHPFLFYGRRPSDWFEGANDGHLYELHFRDAPKGKARAAVARAFEEALKGSAVSSAPQRWLWTGDWALFAVGEKRARRDSDRFFDDIAFALLAIHEVAPLREVVYWGTRAHGKGDGWTEWSRSKQRAPSAGPAYPGLRRPEAYGQGTDPSLGTPAVDEAFEAERRAARGEGARAAAKAKAKKAAASGAPALVPMDEADGIEAPDVPPALRALFGEEDFVRVGASGRVAAMCREDGEYTSVAFVDDAGKRREVALSANFSALSIAPDGKTLLVIARVGYDSARLFEISLPDGAHRMIFAPPSHQGQATSAAYVGSERVALLTGEMLFLLPRAESAVPIATAKCNGSGLVAVDDGRSLLATTYDGATKLFVFSTAGDKLTATAKLKSTVYELWEVDGRIFGWGPDDAFYELTNVLA